ncbi:hypothetical protein Rsub_02829 [Raphidocelis subcapitata]|uniref:Uncharacterized protein n=1 Tax=Raphidocelis subcapitata TaxID=307507 RepID=A0A2V0NQT4_9CHLO|nr:hypothetical protein Rsub_02829 [Raphidocelis subcapitata]|eukprot:GBF89659.1 hypothetical protein Rsub_02829 [Raphidocelis subcapitata]
MPRTVLKPLAKWTRDVQEWWRWAQFESAEEAAAHYMEAWGPEQALSIALRDAAPLALVAELARSGARADALDAQGSTPLHHAVRHMPEMLPLLLLPAGADPQAQDAEGRTALDLALELRAWSAVPPLLRADPAQLARRHATALISGAIADGAGDQEILATIGLAGACGRRCGDGTEATPPDWLVARLQPQQQRAGAAAAGAPPPRCGRRLVWKPLHLALLHGRPQVAAALVKFMQADVNEPLPGPRARRPLAWAAAERDASLVAALLSVGADPQAADARGETAFQICMRRCSADADAPPQPPPSRALPARLRALAARWRRGLRGELRGQHAPSGGSAPPMSHDEWSRVTVGALRYMMLKATGRLPQQGGTGAAWSVSAAAGGTTPRSPAARSRGSPSPPPSAPPALPPPPLLGRASPSLEHLSLDHPRRRGSEPLMDWPPRIDASFEAAAMGWEADRDGGALVADTQWHAGALGAYSDSDGDDSNSWCGADERAGGCPPIAVTGGYAYRASDGAAGGGSCSSGEGEEGCEEVGEALYAAVFDWKAHTAEARDYYGRLIGPGTGRHAPAMAKRDSMC